MNSSFFKLSLFFYCTCSQIIFSTQCFSQRFEAIYEGKMNIQKLKIDSITSKGYDKNGYVENQISINDLPAANITILNIFIRLNDQRKSHFIKYLNNSSRTSNSPDSSVLEGDNWYKYYGTEKTLKNYQWSDSLIATNETKDVFGYICTKYIWLQKNQNIQTELWVCPSLQNWISPFTINIPVNGAILESRQIGMGISYQITHLVM